MLSIVWALLISEIARQRRVRLFELKPIYTNGINRSRQQRLHEIKMGEIFCEFSVYTIFIVVLIFLSYQARDTNSNGLYVSTKKLFITANFRGINTIEKWWHYCIEDLLKGLYAQDWYNGRNLTWREKLMAGNRESIRGSSARLRQLRIKDQSCRVHRRVRHVIGHCRGDYNWLDDDTRDYGTGWMNIVNQTNVTKNTTRCRTPWCYQEDGLIQVFLSSNMIFSIFRTVSGQKVAQSQRSIPCTKVMVISSLWVVI